MGFYTTECTTTPGAKAESRGGVRKRSQSRKSEALGELVPVQDDTRHVLVKKGRRRDRAEYYTFTTKVVRFGSCLDFPILFSASNVKTAPSCRKCKRRTLATWVEVQVGCQTARGDHAKTLLYFTCHPNDTRGGKASDADKRAV